MDLDASPFNQAQDSVDIDDAEDLKLIEEESKQWFGSAASSNDVSIASANRFTHNNTLTNFLRCNSFGLCSQLFLRAANFFTIP